MGQAILPRILLVAKHDPQEPIADRLRRAGYAVVPAPSASGAARLREQSHLDAIVARASDLAGPGAASLRELAASLRIPFVLMQGVGDLDSLLDVVSAALPPDRRNVLDDQLTAGRLRVDHDGHSAYLDGRPLRLTAKEFELLLPLARYPGKVFSRRELLELAWGYGYLQPRLVTVHVGNLNQKAKPILGEHPLVETVRGVGYRLSERVTRSLPGTVEVAAIDCPPPEPFVGRQRDLALLMHRVDAVLSGRTRAVAIAGEAGIGKTRLAEEFALHARERGISVYWGRCRDLLAGAAYGPWQEVLDAIRAETAAGPDPAADDPFGVDEGTASPDPADSTSARLRLFERLVSVLRRRASAGPICIIFDDLQWADISTLLALQFVIRTLRGVPMMIAFLYRPSTPGPSAPLAEVVAGAVRSEKGLSIVLSPFSPAEVSEYLELVRPGRPSTRLSQTIHHKTEGNPFFVSQVVQLLGEQSDLEEERPVDVRLADVEGVRQVVLGHLQRLSASCYAVLEEAAVLGGEFDPSMLAAVAGNPIEALSPLLGEAVSAGVLRIDHAAHRYGFVHDIYREVLYAELASDARARLHGRAGETLEAAGVLMGDPVNAELLHHYLSAVTAGYAGKAVEASFAAARWATSRCAWEEACVYWRRGIDVLASTPAGSPLRTADAIAEAFEALGDVCGLTSDHAGTIEAYGRALSLVSPADLVRRARLKRKQAAAHSFWLEIPQAEAVLLEAEALLHAGEDRSAPAWLDEWMEVRLESLSVACYSSDDVDAGASAAEFGLVVETSGSAAQKARYYETVLMLDLRRRRMVVSAETLESAERSHASNRAVGTAPALLAAEWSRALPLAFLPAERPRALRQTLRYLELARKQRHSVHELEALWMLGVCYRAAGDVDKTAEWSRRAVRLSEESEQTAWYRAEARGNLAWVAGRAGDWEQARTLAEGAVVELERSYPRTQFEWQVRWTLLALALRAAEWSAAGRQALAILEPCQQKMPDDLEHLLFSLCDAVSGGTAPGPGIVEEVETCAVRYGYL